MAVRWTGYYTPAETGLHTFQTRADDGVRLTVNGVLVQDVWWTRGRPTGTARPST